MGRRPKEKANVNREDIAELLSLSGWSRKELADKLGLSLNTIDRWLSEKHRLFPSIENAEKMWAWLLEAREAKMREWKRDAKRALSHQPQTVS